MTDRLIATALGQAALKAASGCSTAVNTHCFPGRFRLAWPALGTLSRGRCSGVLLSFCALSLTAGCDQMAQQPRADAQEASAFFRDGKVNQAPPEGTVARGETHWRAALGERPPLTGELLARGKERYRINCVPCHGLAGDGAGAVVNRGFPRPPDLAEARLRAAPDHHFVEVITHGYGVMYSYAARVAPADRWAIVAHIRALQLARHAEADGLPDADRAELEATP